MNGAKSQIYKCSRNWPLRPRTVAFDALSNKTKFGGQILTSSEFSAAVHI